MAIRLHTVGPLRIFVCPLARMGNGGKSGGGFEMIATHQALLPLPGGEGWGEGERHKSITHLERP